MESEDHMEFAFPDLSPLRGCSMDHPYIYILTDKEGQYIGVFPTLKHLAYHFGLKSCCYDPQEYLMRAWWMDNRSYFVPYDLVFGADDPNRVLDFKEVPEHFTERNLECYVVKHFWHNETLKARGLPEQRSAVPDSVFNYKHPPECVPKIGWVDENHPMHSKYKSKG